MKTEPTTVQVRLSANLVKKAEEVGNYEMRSKTKQLEFWAIIGAAMAPKLSSEDCNKIMQHRDDSIEVPLFD